MRVTHLFKKNHGGKTMAVPFSAKILPTFVFSFLLVFSGVFPLRIQAEDAAGSTAENVGNGSPDQKFLDELLRRGLYRLAELHCRERLAVRTLPTASRAELTLELIRVFQERALCVSGPEKDALEEQARRVFEDFCDAAPESPWMLPVEFQYTTGLFASVRRMEMEAQFALDRDARMEETREALRDVIRRLEKIDRGREEQVLKIAQNPNIPKRTSKKNSGAVSASAEAQSVSRFAGDALSLWELESLKNNVQYQFLLTYILQAETYPAESLDRISALKEAQSRARGLTMIPAESALYWNARIAEIQCFRLLNDFASARSRIEFVEKQGAVVPETIRLEILAEKIRLFTGEKNLEEAKNLVHSELHEALIGKNGELDCAVLELYLALWDDAMKTSASNNIKNDGNAETSGNTGAENTGDAKNNQTKIDTDSNTNVQESRENALAILNLIRAKSHPWWVRRAEILFDGMLKNAGEKENIPFLLLAAENACRNFDPDADAACERLWNAAMAQKDEQNAIHAALLAGSFLYKKEKKEASAAWFRKAAVQFPTNSEAVKNHNLAISIATEALSAVLSASDSKLDDALNARLDAYQTLLIEHFQLFGKTDPNVRETLKKLETVMKIRGKFAECVDISMFLVAQTPATDPNYEAEETSAFETWSKYLTQLRTSAAPEFRTALLTAIRWSETLPESETRARGMFPFLCELYTLELASEEGSARQKALAAVELRLFNALKSYRDAFPPEIFDELEQIGTHAMLVSGNQEEAFPYYEKIAQKFPSRRDVQLTWGRLLADEALRTHSSVRMTQALEQWRSIEKHTENQTSEWYEAKYWVIRFTFKNGDAVRAARLFRAFQILHPDLGGEPWKEKFEELSARFSENLTAH